MYHTFETNPAIINNIKTDNLKFFFTFICISFLYLCLMTNVKKNQVLSL